jgi:hypothetical protein
MTATTLACLAAGLCSGPVLAQQLSADAGSALSLFISPAGQVFRASSGRDPLDAWWTQADADHDEQISQAEMTADFERVFRQIDSNADGVLSAAEIALYQQGFRSDAVPPPLAGAPPTPPAAARRRPAAAATPPTGAGAIRPAPARAGLARFNPLGEDNPLMAADTDGDGQITLDEFRLRSQRAFAQLDLSGDGQLRRIELPALGEPQRGRTAAGSLPSSRPW